MIPLDFKTPILHFLDRVDFLTSSEVMKTPNRCEEKTITHLLLRSFDKDFNLGLDYTILDLERDVAQISQNLGGSNTFSLDWTIEGLDQLFEGRVTQSDYILHLSFTDSSEDEEAAKSNSWDAYYLVQAKIAKINENNKNTTWNSLSKFTDSGNQNRKILYTRDIFGNNGIIYNLYCPRNAISYAAPDSVKNLLIDFNRSDAREIEICKNSGLWTSHYLPSTLGNLFLMDNEAVCPWSLFISDHYFSARPNHKSYIDVLYRDQSAHEKIAFLSRKALFQRSPEIIQNIQDYLETSNLLNETERALIFDKIGYRHIVHIDGKFPAYQYTNKPGGLTP